MTEHSTLPDWDNPRCIGRNKEPPPRHAGALCRCRRRRWPATARPHPTIKLLNGAWQFRYAANPAAAPDAWAAADLADAAVGHHRRAGQLADAGLRPAHLLQCPVPDSR